MTEPQNRTTIAGLAFALLFLPVAANATDFKCGEAYITFPTLKGSYDGEMLVRGLVTIPKKDVLRVFTLDETPGSSSTLAILRNPTGTGVRIRAITPPVRDRIIDCLD